MNTNNPDFNKQHEVWMNNLISKSTQISRTSEKIRNLFFKALLKKVADLRKYVEENWEGKDKEQLKVYIKELEWRISKLEFYEIKAASPVDVVQEAFDVEETIVLLELVNRFIAAIDARIAEIPAA